MVQIVLYYLPLIKGSKVKYSKFSSVQLLLPEFVRLETPSEEKTVMLKDAFMFSHPRTQKGSFLTCKFLLSSITGGVYSLD